MSIIAKYKFDSSIYADLIPEFNAEFTSDLYTVTDEVDSENSNYIIRTIESDSLPTLMRFGYNGDDTENNEYDGQGTSLLKIYDMNTSELTTGYRMFKYCKRVESINANWNTSNMTNMFAMFYQCTNLTSLDLSNADTSKVTNMQSMFCNCNNLTSLDLSNFDTSKVTNMRSMFSGCTNLTSLDLSNFDTSNVTSIHQMFSNCNNLTTLDVSNFNTSNVTDMNNIFTSTNNLKYLKCNNVATLNTLNTYLPTKSSTSQGTIICKTDTTNLDTTTLQSKNWTVNTNPTLIAKYKYDSTIYKNLIPVFNDGYMGFVEDEEVDENGIVTRKIEHVELPSRIRFGDSSGSNITDRCLSLLEVLDMNTNELTTAYAMFMRNKNLTKINCNWNTSKINDFGRMFYNCQNLKEVELEKIDVSNGAHINYMFYYCYNLPNTLDLSSWNISNVINANNLFSNCTSIQRLDISNFNINSSVDFNDAFKNIKNLTDIGMIYCDQSTINKVASLLPTDHNIAIWVESDDILQYDQYDHITYKTQKVQDTVHLNSPLLMGDTIEVIDGKTYHVHRWEKVVLDGSENYSIYLGTTDGGWTEYSDTKVFYYSYLAFPNVAPFESLFCDRLLYVNKISLVNEKGISNVTWGGDQNSTGQNGHIAFRLMNNELSDFTKEGFKQWLSENPTTVIYKLKTPYYELISEEPLELTLLDTTDNTINNNSILPSNMTIANKELSIIAIKPSTIYTLAFDKSIPTSNITIDICGSSQVTTSENMITLTTPSELGSGIRFLSSDGCIISNVRLLEGTLVGEEIPRDSFEGLKSSFEDGLIPYDNLWDINELLKSNVETTTTITDNSIKINNPTSWTKVGLKLYNTLNKTYTLAVKIEGNPRVYYRTEHELTVSGEALIVENNINKFYLRTIQFNTDNSLICFEGANNNIVNYNDIVILEGDHTHLSEEDFNHLGKYKVEYKVTGKNKFDKNKELQVIDSKFNSENHYVDFNDDYIKVEYGLYGVGIYLGSIGSFKKGAYTISCECYLEELDSSSVYLGHFTNDNCKDKKEYKTTEFNTWESFKYTFSLDNDTDSLYLQFQAGGSASKYSNLDFRVRNIQLEEGTVATEYEPYKEDIKTYYLSSPFLEGDTIEDVNGVATHVKRYGKVVLDGSENWRVYNIFTNEYSKENLTTFSIDTFIQNDNGWSKTICYCDKFDTVVSMNNPYWRVQECLGIGNEQVLVCTYKAKTLNEFKQWLQANPITVVYQLASPQYEKISDESILCDSYVNGHLDIDSDIPVEKVEFNGLRIPLKYQSNSTNYIVQFESDNNGIIDEVYFGGSNNPSLQKVLISKGVNVLKMATGNGTIASVIHLNGIGFNVSNIQVVADATHENGDVKEFDYFKGLKSTFEDRLITDENDEHYGQYAVSVKVVGKNKAPSLVLNTNVNLETGVESSNDTCKMSDYIKIDLNKDYIAYRSIDDGEFVPQMSFCYYDKEFKYISGMTNSATGVLIIPSNASYVRLRLENTKTSNIKWYLAEESSFSEYEPYKESSYTIYLNSPLLKDDTIEVVDEKLSHVHRYEYRPYEEGDINNQLPTDLVNTLISLATPTVENIEPIQSGFVLSSVKEGDMTIDTALPIKIDLEYRTNMAGTSALEEQLANVQNGADLIDIINSEVDE